jgi:hypothetical protein
LVALGYQESSSAFDVLLAGPDEVLQIHPQTAAWQLFAVHFKVPHLLVWCCLQGLMSCWRFTRTQTLFAELIT